MASNAAGVRSVDIFTGATCTVVGAATGRKLSVGSGDVDVAVLSPAAVSEDG
jgi:hypothetical protein